MVQTGQGLGATRLLAAVGNMGQISPGRVRQPAFIQLEQYPVLGFKFHFPYLLLSAVKLAQAFCRGLFLLKATALASQKIHVLFQGTQQVVQSGCPGRVGVFQCATDRTGFPGPELLAQFAGSLGGCQFGHFEGAFGLGQGGLDGGQVVADLSECRFSLEDFRVAGHRLPLNALQQFQTGSACFPMPSGTLQVLTPSLQLLTLQPGAFHFLGGHR